jgi:hypothetical protein
VFAEIFYNQLQQIFDRYYDVDLMHLYHHINKKFNWHMGRKSELMPVDPFCTYFHPEPTPLGKMFYSIKQVWLRVFETGITVPSYCVSDLFYSAEIEARSSRVVEI